MASLKLLGYMFPQRCLRPATTTSERVVSVAFQATLQSYLVCKEIKLYGVLIAASWVVFKCWKNPAACATDAELKALCLSAGRVVSVPYTMLVLATPSVILWRLFGEWSTGTLKTLKLV